MNPVVSLKMLYPDAPVEAFQANETLLVVIAVTWKLPGVDGGVGALPGLAEAGKGSTNEATVKTAATAQVAKPKTLPEIRFWCFPAAGIRGPFFWLNFCASAGVSRLRGAAYLAAFASAKHRIDRRNENGKGSRRNAKKWSLVDKLS